MKDGSIIYGLIGIGLAQLVQIIIALGKELFSGNRQKMNDIIKLFSDHVRSTQENTQAIAILTTQFKEAKTQLDEIPRLRKDIDKLEVRLSLQTKI